MSWWDTSSISNLATQALKNAQKKIDKVLDIEADQKSGRSKKKKASLQGEDSTSTIKEDTKEEKGSGHDFWSGWMGKSEEDNAASSPSHGSSWHLPWASPSQETQASASDASLSDQSNRTSGRLSHLSSRRKEPPQEAVSSPATNLEEPKQKIDIESNSEEKAQEDQNEEFIAGSAEMVSPPSEEVTVEPVPTRESENVSDCVTESESNQVEKNSTLDVEKSYPEAESLQEANCDRESKNLDQSELEESEKVVSDSLKSSSEIEEQNKLIDSESVSQELCNQDFLSQSTPEDQNQESAESGWQDADADFIIDEDEDADKTCGISSLSEPLHMQTDHQQPKVDESMSIEETHHLEKTFDSIDVPKEESIDTSHEESHLADDLDSEQTSEQTPGRTSGKTEQDASSDINAPCVSFTTTNNQPESSDSIAAFFSQEEETNQNDPDKSAMDGDSKATVDVPVHSITAPDLGEESTSVSSDMSVINDPDHRSLEDVEDSKNISQVSEEKSLSQEYVNVGTGCGTSQVISLDGSALSSDDCLQSSYELDLEGVANNSVNDPDLVRDLAGSTGSSDTSRLDSSADTVVVGRIHHDSDPTADSGYSLFGKDSTALSEDQEEAQDKLESPDPDACQDSSSSTHSTYVKSLIQDAMDDLSNKTEDSGSDNHSNSEVKSESSKVDSEIEKSVHSGHESSDDIETNTSSDIEILSAPHSNGEAASGGEVSKFHTPFDLTPLRMAQQGVQLREASDSRSTSSSNSKAEEGERLSPERTDGASWRDDEISHHELASVKEEGPDSPYHPERLLKKLAEMAEVLQAREAKLISLSKENHSLAEDVSILKCQLKKAEEARDAEAADLDALTQEFTLRIGEAEKKMQTVLKEKDRLKQQLTTAEKELERRSADADVEAMLEEKRQQVEELLLEGEKLSKQQLQSSTIIKKLRAKEKENDATITSQKKKLEDQTAELDHLKVVLNSKEEMEKKQNEAIGQLNTAVQRQEKELAKIRSDLEDAQEKSRGLQVALDNSYKEIAELHKSNATQDSKAQEAALSAETHVREELKAAMERDQMRFKKEREAFIMQADDLRLDMARLEKEHSRREDLLRQEISHLQTRLQEDEARSQELTQSVSSATRPLLRQIENLQATYGAQANAWERVEKSLTDRLAEAQTSLAVAQEKERTSSQQYMELSAKVAALEASNSNLRQEKATLSAKIEGDKSRLEELQDTRNSVVAQLESSKKVLSEELAQLRMDKMHLESQLSVEHTRVETEKKKSVALEEQLRLAERPRSRGTPSPSPSMSVSRQESVVGSIHEGYSGNMMNWSFHDESDSGSTVGVSRASVYDSLRQSGAAIAVENMSSQLKLREGEITQLQSEISRLERTRESMARELVNLSNQNEELQDIKLQHEQLQVQFKELNQRYSAILQMYGEKEEQVQELRLDLQDVKEMYKTQIDALMAK